MACGGNSSDASNEEETGEAAATEESSSEELDLSNAMSQAKDALEKAGMGQTSEPVNFRELKKLLPEKVMGLEQTDQSGETTGAMGFNISQAEAEYTGEDGKRIKIALIDTGGLAMAALSMAAWANLTVDKEDSNGYERTSKIDGYKAYEKYDSRNQDGEISVFVKDRFIVKVDGRKVEMDDIKEALKALDLDDLGDLK